MLKTLNVFSNYRNGVTRTLLVDIEKGKEIDITVQLQKGKLHSELDINLSRSEAIALAYHLVKELMPGYKIWKLKLKNV